MDRKQPVCHGVDEKGELVWGFIPMARWQAAMFPSQYHGDFMAFWTKLDMLERYGLETDCANIDFLAFIPWQIEPKYKAAKALRDGGKGD